MSSKVTERIILSESILASLIDKKDLKTYIGLRIEELKEAIGRVPKSVMPKKRGRVIWKLKGRIAELRSLRALVAAGKIKSQAKAL